MGVNLREIFERHEVAPEWYAGKRIAIDGHNVAFRYLTTIRTRDGDFLRNKDGRVTSHLYGFSGLVSQLRQFGAEPILIWDGEIHPRKRETVQSRIDGREKALAAAEQAQREGNDELYQKLVRQTVYVTPEMIADTTRMMETVGVAVVTAPNDGERFGAALCLAGHADAVATEDFDALVAGAPTVLRKAGGKDPFLHHLSDLDTHELSLAQLRELAVVCGTDWHPGVKGLGPKTTAKLLREHGSIVPLLDAANSGDESSRAHKLLAASDFTVESYESLLDYVADLPQPEKPVAAKSCPEMVEAYAADMGFNQDRLMSCLC